ncbi:hypothetical protein BN159_5836 [Streptomyces davaonensis JCM 4913]|uniref:Uncharacterized protein n=1 Tax=Streptomyces davaonensis (strain DSM 101723 / JCM 4913 / KCC S-0913 / 768) TaxID=1214101 RepID=K4RAM1_STRDJ|nr:hypothetical protein BN159_5836 [Streptomyces davaonensis JCM 4913]
MLSSTDQGGAAGASLSILARTSMIRSKSARHSSAYCAVRPGSPGSSLNQDWCRSTVRIRHRTR